MRLLLILCLATTLGAAELPLISSPVSGSHDIDPAEKLPLAWTTVANAKIYRVQVSRNPEFSDLLQLKDAEIEADPALLGQEYTLTFADDTETLTSGALYFWRVTALMQDGSEVTTAPAHFVTLKDPFVRLRKHRVSLTRAEEGVDKDKPATISFIRKGEDAGEQQYLAEFLLGWKGQSRFFPRDGRFSLAFAASIAGKLTNDSEDVDTMAKSSVGVVADTSFGNPKVTASLYQSLSLSYEGDQGYDTRKAVADYLVTVSTPRIGPFHGTTSSAVQTAIRPYLGLTVGRNVEPGESAEVEQQIFRIVPRIDVTFRLNRVATTLGVADVVLSLTDKLYFLPNEERDRYNLFTASLDFEIAKGLSTGLSFKNGHDAPRFEGTNTLALTIGVKFGG